MPWRRCISRSAPPQAIARLSAARGLGRRAYVIIDGVPHPTLTIPGYELLRQYVFIKRRVAPPVEPAV